jgi:hypothetical protein
MFKNIILFFILNFITKETVAAIFYPFGVLNQDIKVPKVDEENIGPIRFIYRTSFKYFNKEYSSLYINPNGLISFDSNNLGFYGTDFSYPNSIFTAIAPFWSDIDTTSCGDIYYRETTDTNTLSLISNDLNFRATWAFIVTYDRVCKYGPPYDGLTNSFQIVITTNGNASYTIYNYGQLSWFQDDLNYALYNAGDGINYSILPGSLSSEILKLSIWSNIGISGRWIFDNFDDRPFLNISNFYPYGIYNNDIRAPKADDEIFGPIRF